MNTELSQKTSSKSLALDITKNIAEIILLAAIGAIGVLLHAKFRVPLKLPGHHGIIYMALLIAGRLFSKKPYASSLSSVGAAVMLFFPLGFKDPFMPLIYLLPGVITDFGMGFGKRNTMNILWIALICGLSYMTLPISRIIITTVTGLPYGSFINGFLWPCCTHFVFGAIGGLAGVSLMRLFKKKKEQH